MEEKVVFANDLLASVEDHRKQITIRRGFRSYAIGQPIPVFAATGHEQFYKLIPFRVTHCLAKDITEDHLIEDGFSGHDDMYEQMAAFYPDFGPDSEATVLEFETAL